MDYIAWGGRTIAVPLGTPLVVNKNGMIYRDEMSSNTTAERQVSAEHWCCQSDVPCAQFIGTWLEICRICDYRRLLTPRQQKTE